jgi:hypothetical protein
MSEINLQFSVNTYTASFTANTNPIVVNPVTNNLMLFTGFAAYPPAGGAGNGQVTFNDAGLFSGSNNFTYANNTNTLTVQNITANTITSSGNVTIGNVSSTGNVNVAGNITTANFTVNSKSNLGNIPNITIAGGSNGQFIKTDGTGNISFATIPAGGSNMQLQFNSANTLGGIPNVTWNGVKLSLGNVANVLLEGGTNGYVLQTDGAGNLTWQAQAGNVTGNGSPGGANTQVQFNRSGVFGGAAGFTFNNPSNTLTIINANVTGNLTANTISGNLNTTGNIITTGNLSVGNANLGNAATANYFIGSGANLTNINASNIVGTLANSNYSAYSGNVTIAAQSNITSLGSLTSLTVVGTTSIQQAKEKVTANSLGSTGTVNFDLLSQAILYKSGNATANFTINFRGNSTTTFDSFASSNEAVTCTYINTNGSPAYYASSFRIDGTVVNPFWTGTQPAAGTVNAKDVYTFNILKTAANTYVILASAGAYV